GGWLGRGSDRPAGARGGYRRPPAPGSRRGSRRARHRSRSRRGLPFVLASGEVLGEGLDVLVPGRLPRASFDSPPQAEGVLRAADLLDVEVDLVGLRPREDHLPAEPDGAVDEAGDSDRVREDRGGGHASTSAPAAASARIIDQRRISAAFAVRRSPVFGPTGKRIANACP